MKSGEDYAFQITQGGERNYSALLKAGPPVKAESALQSSQTNTATNTNTNTNTITNSAQTSSSSSSSTSDTGTSANQATAMASKPLISSSGSSAGASPYSSPVSSTTVTNSVTVAEPFETSNVVHGKKASATTGVQNGSALSLQSYSQFLMGGLVLLVYLVQ